MTGVQTYIETHCQVRRKDYDREVPVALDLDAIAGVSIGLLVCPSTGKVRYRVAEVSDLEETSVKIYSTFVAAYDAYTKARCHGGEYLVC